MTPDPAEPLMPRPHPPEATPAVGFTFDGVRYDLTSAGRPGVPLAVHRRSGLAWHRLEVTEGARPPHEAACLVPLRSIEHLPLAAPLMAPGAPAQQAWLVPLALDEVGSTPTIAAELGRAAALLDCGLAAEATARCHRVLASDPHHAYASKLWARALRASGADDAALQHLEEAIEVHPHLLVLYRQLIPLAVQLDRVELVLRCFQRLQRSFPQERAFDSEGIQAMLLLGRPEEAQVLLGRAHLPGGAREHFAQRASDALDRYARADKLFRGAQQLRLQRRSRRAANELLARAQAADPLHGLATLNLALARAQERDFDEAIPLLERARPLIPAQLHPKVHANLGFCYLSKGQPEAALAALAQAWRALQPLLQQHDPARPSGYLAPGLASWVDEEQCIESSSAETLEIVTSAITACEEAGLAVPPEVGLLRAFYARADAPPDDEIDLDAVFPPYGTSALPPPPSSDYPGLEEALADLAAEAERDLSAWEPGGTPLPDLVVLDALPPRGSHPRYMMRHPVSGERIIAERVPAATSDERRRLWSALRTWFNLPEHSHVVTCKGFHSLDGEVAVLFEAVRAPLLDDWVSELRSQELDPPELTRLLLGLAVHLAWALEVAHRNGVTHGPLTLDQVHVLRAPAVKVGGFWQGRCLGDDDDIEAYLEHTLRDAPPLGSLLREAYEIGLRSQMAAPTWQALDEAGPLAPEHRRGQGHTVSSDAWYWAHCMVTVLCRTLGITTAQPASVHEQLAVLVRSDHVGTSSWQLPAELTSILGRCLSPRPHLRPRSMAEVAETLRLVHAHQLAEPFAMLPSAVSGLRATAALGQALSPARHGTDTARKPGEGGSASDASSGDEGGGIGAIEGGRRGPSSGPIDDDLHDDLPWRDPRRSLNRAYQVAGVEPLIGAPYLPEADLDPRSLALAHLVALEVSCGLLAGPAASSPIPHLTAELSRQHFDVSLILWQLGDTQGATRAGDRALELLESLEDRETSAAFRYLLVSMRLEHAALLRAVKQPERAAELVARAEASYIATTPSAGERRVEKVKAIAALKLGRSLTAVPKRHEAALAYYDEAISLMSAQGNDEGAGHAHASKAMHLARLGRDDEALEHLERAEQLLEGPAFGDHDPQAQRALGRAWLAHGGLALRRDDQVAARKAATQADRLYTQLVEKHGVHELAPYLAQSSTLLAQVQAHDDDIGPALLAMRRASLALHRHVLLERSPDAMASYVGFLHVEADLCASVVSQSVACGLAASAVRWSERLLERDRSLPALLLHAESLVRHGSLRLDEAAGPDECAEARSQLLEAARLLALLELDEAFKRPPMQRCELSFHLALACHGAGLTAEARAHLDQAQASLGEVETEEEGLRLAMQVLQLRCHDLGVALALRRGDLDGGLAELHRAAPARGAVSETSPTGFSSARFKALSTTQLWLRGARVQHALGLHHEARETAREHAALLEEAIKRIGGASPDEHEPSIGPGLAVTVLRGRLMEARHECARHELECGDAAAASEQYALAAQLAESLPGDGQAALGYLRTMAPATQLLHASHEPEPMLELAAWLVERVESMLGDPPPPPQQGGFAARELLLSTAVSTALLAQLLAARATHASATPPSPTRLGAGRRWVAQLLGRPTPASDEATRFVPGLVPAAASTSKLPPSTSPQGLLLQARAGALRVRAAMQLGAMPYARRVLPEALAVAERVFHVDPLKGVASLLDLRVCEASLEPFDRARAALRRPELRALQAAAQRLGESGERAALLLRCQGYERLLDPAAPASVS